MLKVLARSNKSKSLRYIFRFKPHVHLKFLGSKNFQYCHESRLLQSKGILIMMSAYTFWFENVTLYHNKTEIKRKRGEKPCLEWMFVDKGIDKSGASVRFSYTHNCLEFLLNEFFYHFFCMDLHSSSNGNIWENTV